MTDRETALLTDDTEAAIESPATEEPIEPVVHVPDRADAPVSEITERFLRAIIAHVPLDRLEELHLFSPLKQGGVETGIAVVAARVPVEVPAAAALELPLADLGPTADATGVTEIIEDEIDADVEDVAVIELDPAEIAVDVHAVEVEAVDVDVVEIDAVEDDAIDAEADDESPYADEENAVHADATGVVIASEAADDELVIDDIVPAPIAAPIERHTVYTARYRLVQKGPERGRWEADVVAEADAPLITVEMVVRGVQRRAGEESEILRYSARQIAKALRLEWPIPTV